MGVWGAGMEGERKGRREGNGKREEESEEVDKDGGREIGWRSSWTAVRAPSSPLCVPVLFSPGAQIGSSPWSSYLPQGHGGTVL